MLKGLSEGGQKSYLIYTFIHSYAVDNGVGIGWWVWLRLGLMGVASRRMMRVIRTTSAMVWGMYRGRYLWR